MYYKNAIDPKEQILKMMLHRPESGGYRRKFNNDQLLKETYRQKLIENLPLYRNSTKFKILGILLLIFLIINSNEISAQNCQSCPEKILNSDLHIDPTINPPLTNGQNTFPNNQVPNWFATYNTPHHVKHHPTITPTFTPPICSAAFHAGGEIVNCMAADNANNNNEGIHQNFNFVENPFISYCVKLRLQRLDCDVNPPIGTSIITVRAAKLLPLIGISPINENHGIAANFSIIGSVNVTDYNEITQEFVYNPFLQANGKNLNQFEIFQHSAVSGDGPNIPFTSSVSIKEVSLTCQTTALTGINSSTGMPGNCGLTWNFSPILNQNDCLKDENYTWTVNGPGLNNVNFSNSKNSMFIFPGGGKYTVCLKYTDCNGCCAEVCKEVEVVECGCQPKQGFISLNATNGANISTLLGTNQNHNNVRWLVKGNLIINQNTVISNNSIIEMEPNARITVEPGVRFHVLGNTILQAGCNEMWAGIHFRGTGSYRILNSTIRDAENAINITNSAQLTLTGNNFERNFTCINLNRASNPFSRTTGISGNTFDGSHNLLAPRINQLGQNGIIGTDVGNVFISSDLTSITGINTFRFLNSAINLDKYSRLLSRLNSFENMRTGGKTILLKEQFELGLTSLIQNSFSTGNVGIEIEKCNGTINIRTNTFYNHPQPNPNFGRNIHAKNCANLNLNIDEQNVFNSSSLSVTIDNIRAGQVNIINNTFNTCRQNIDVLNIVPTCRILTNTINTYERKAIVANNLSKAEIINNTINSINQQTGLHATRCPNAIIHDNTIINAGQFALEIANCENFDAQCNQLINCASGPRISSAIVKGTFRTNEISNISQHPYLTMDNTAIGLQDKAGNKFIGTNTNAILANSNVNNNIFTYRNTPLSGNERWFPESANADWFREVDNGTNATCEFFNIAQPITTQAALVNAVNSNVLNNMYYDQNVWSAQWYALHSLQNNPSLMIGNSTLANFYNTQSTLRLYYNMDKNISELYDFTSAEQSILNNNTNLLSTKLNQLDALQQQITDTNFGQFVTSSTILNDEIYALFDAMLPIYNTRNQRAINNAHIYKNAVNLLPQPHYFSDEYKVVFNARLDEILYGRDYARITYGSNLIDIASKCSIDFGLPVFQAAIMCDQYGLAYNYSTCTTSQPRSNEDDKIKKTVEINIYPNPTSGKIEIENHDRIKELTIFGVDGKVILKSYHVQDQMDLTNFQNGIYIIQMIDVENKINTKKLIKQE